MRWLSDVLHSWWDSVVKPIRTQLIRCIPRRAISKCREFGNRLICRENRNRNSRNGPTILIGSDNGDVVLSPISGNSVSELERGTMVNNPVVTQNLRFAEGGFPQSALKLSLSGAGLAPPTSDSQHTLHEQAPVPTTSAAEEDTSKPKPGSRLRQLAWKVAERESLHVPKTQRNSRGSAVLFTMHTIVGRLTTLRPALRKLEVTHTILESTGLVRHLQFSPNGKLLATCAWDGTARLFNVPQDANDEIGKHRVMNVFNGFLGQVAWSPNGKWLLTRWANGMAIWSEVSTRAIIYWQYSNDLNLERCI
jgi:WD40 repeat protein